MTSLSSPRRSLRVVVPFLPVYNHRLGVGYLTAVLRARGHEVILVDFEHLLRVGAPDLSLRIQEETEVYADHWSEQIQYLHRPELLFGALHPEDPATGRGLRDADWSLLEELGAHVRRWVDAILQLEPDVLLLSCLVSNLWVALWVGEFARRRRPDLPRIIGGRGVTYLEVQELIRRAGWAEAVLPGEAEGDIAAVVETVAAQRSFENVGAGATPLDLDALPRPDYQGLPFPGATLRHYDEWGRDFHDAASIGGSRWCPRTCAYCYESIYPRNYRLRRAEAVALEIEEQRDRLGTPRLFFCDSTLNVSPPWLDELVDRMSAMRPRPQVVFAHCEPRRLAPSTLEKMSAAGFAKLNIGIESFDEHTLARMNRLPTAAETEQTLLAAAAAGLSLGVNLVVNYPGESAQEFQRSLGRAGQVSEKLRRVCAKSGATIRFMVSQARIDPHSALFERREQYGVKLRSRSLPVPAALAHLQPLFDRIALEWDDGLPRAERHARFGVARPYLEGLSIAGRARPQAEWVDVRTALHLDRVPTPLRTLLPAPVRAGSEARA